MYICFWFPFLYGDVFTLMHAAIRPWVQFSAYISNVWTFQYNFNVEKYDYSIFLWFYVPSVLFILVPMLLNTVQ